VFSFECSRAGRVVHSFPTRRSSDLAGGAGIALAHLGIFIGEHDAGVADLQLGMADLAAGAVHADHFSSTENIFVIFDGLGSALRSEEHTSELQSLRHLVCRLLLEKK